MFLDEVKLKVKSGNGGRGCTSFRREKFVPRGGPDGGDGGRGGHVILRVDSGLNSLTPFRHRKVFEASAGKPGEGGNRRGKDAQDLILEVPSGTAVYDTENNKLLADLVEDGEEFIVVEGGRGGRGNSSFATSRRQTPKHSELGAPGEEKEIRLELKLLAEVGLVGPPNAGKSTLLSRVTNARPRIADYPFTTLSPYLGVVEWKGGSMIWADLPGLISGAHEGAGLGYQFLRHIERTKVLLYVVDGSGLYGEDPLSSFEKIREEIKKYKQNLEKRPALVAFNKIDLLEAQENLQEFKKQIESESFECIPISAATGKEIETLLTAVSKKLKDAPEPEVEKPVMTEKGEEPEKPFVIRKEGDIYVVEGGQAQKRIDRTDFDNEESVKKLLDYLQKQGLYDVLKEMDIPEGTTFQIGPMEFEYLE